MGRCDIARPEAEWRLWPRSRLFLNNTMLQIWFLLYNAKKKSLLNDWLCFLSIYSCTWYCGMSARQIISCNHLHHRCYNCHSLISLWLLRKMYSPLSRRLSYGGKPVLHLSCLIDDYLVVAMMSFGDDGHVQLAKW